MLLLRKKKKKKLTLFNPFPLHETPAKKAESGLEVSIPSPASIIITTPAAPGSSVWPRHRSVTLQVTEIGCWKC